MCGGTQTRLTARRRRSTNSPPPPPPQGIHTDGLLQEEAHPHQQLEFLGGLAKRYNIVYPAVSPLHLHLSTCVEKREQRKSQPPPGSSCRTDDAPTQLSSQHGARTLPPPSTQDTKYQRLRRSLPLLQQVGPRYHPKRWARAGGGGGIGEEIQDMPCFPAFVLRGPSHANETLNSKVRVWHYDQRREHTTHIYPRPVPPRLLPRPRYIDVNIYYNTPTHSNTHFVLTTYVVSDSRISTLGGVTLGNTHHPALGNRYIMTS